MQTRTVEVGEVLVIDGVRLTVLAVVGGEVFLGVGEPDSAPGQGMPVQSLLPLAAWLDPSPN